ncbi:hypothetical protein DFH06DRAFT_1224687 [Mycena polygramma]|nr:hypothetical protein DFH06DRAFT_1224687 [Mycena polygramma]
MNAPTPSLVAPISPSQVQESRTKRLVRQQARFRDRGGIFVPRTHNNLLDILLGKKKPSPLKGRSRSRSRSISVSPTKRLSRGPSVGRKSSGIAAKKAKTLVGDREDEPDQPIAGPSRLPNAKKPPTKATASRKGKKAATADDDTPGESKPAPKRKGRAPKSKQAIEKPTKTTTSKPAAKRKTKAIASEEPTVQDSDDEALPGPSKKRAPAAKSRTSRKTADAAPEEGTGSKPSKSSAKSTVKAASSAKLKAKPKTVSAKTSEDPEVDVDPPPRARRSRAVKPRQTYAELSDDEDETEVPKVSRGKKIAAKQPSELVSAKQKGKQREVDDVPAETPIVAKSKSKGKGKAPEEEAEKPAKPKAKTTGKKRALEPEPVDDDDGESRPVKKRKPDPPPKADPPSRQRLEAIPEEDEEEEELSSVETPVQPVQKKGASKVDEPTAALDSVPPVAKKKRPRDQNEDAQTTRKRAKVAEATEAPAAPTKPKKKRASAKRSKPASKPADKEAKQTLKENTPTSVTLSEPAAKPASVIKRTGPPKSVLDRVRAHAGSRLVAEDDEPDELDFLS